MQQTLRVIVTTSLFALSAGLQEAKAADFGGTALRGSIQPQSQSTEALWDGVYVGALGGYSGADVKVKSAAYSLLSSQIKTLALNQVANLASDFSTPAKTASSTAFGAFIGYNTTWEDVVIGFESDYQRTNLKTSSSNSTNGNFGIGRQVVSGGINYDYTAASEVSSNITDIGSLRGRVGYAMGNALPFLTLGLGFIHGKSSVAAYLNDKEKDTAVPPKFSPSNTTYTASYAKRSKFAVGLAAGAGVDYAFTPSIFLRAEYMHMRFSSFDGQQINLNNARVGVAAKF